MACVKLKNCYFTVGNGCKVYSVLLVLVAIGLGSEYARKVV